jgi:O-methyltransferase
MSTWLKRSVKRLATRAGYEVRGLHRMTPDGSQEALHPIATYSPWNTDAEFSRLFEIIKRQTLVDRYRCFDLWSLVGQVQHLEGSILEVGVWKGGTGALISRRAQLFPTPAHVYLCDTFAGVVKASDRDDMYRGGEHADASRAEVEALLARVGAGNATILEGIFPDDTAHRISAGPFRFCHIDVDVYESARQTTEWVWDRLVPGGIIVYDDYGFFGCEGVRAFVDEQANRGDRVSIYNLNGHATVIKLR